MDVAWQSRQVTGEGEGVHRMSTTGAAAASAHGEERWREQSPTVEDEDAWLGLSFSLNVNYFLSIVKSFLLFIKKIGAF